MSVSKGLKNRLGKGSFLGSWRVIRSDLVATSGVIAGTVEKVIVEKVIVEKMQTSFHVPFPSESNRRG